MAGPISRSWRHADGTAPHARAGHAKRIPDYLPPGYDCTDRRYPVLYLDDGHDLFAWIPFAADLDPPLAAEIATRKAGMAAGAWTSSSTGRWRAMNVVGIAVDEGLRSRDLAPVPCAWRTIAAPRCRGIAGASLGGVSALQIGLGYPETIVAWPSPSRRSGAKP